MTMDVISSKSNRSNRDSVVRVTDFHRGNLVQLLCELLMALGRLSSHNCSCAPENSRFNWHACPSLCNKWEYDVERPRLWVEPTEITNIGQIYGKDFPA